MTPTVEFIDKMVAKLEGLGWEQVDDNPFTLEKSYEQSSRVSRYVLEPLGWRCYYKYPSESEWSEGHFSPWERILCGLSQH